MATSKETTVTVWCDVEGCVEWVQVSERSDRGARRASRCFGWRQSGGKDICPKHAKGEMRWQ